MNYGTFIRLALQDRYDAAEEWRRRSANLRPVSMSTGKLVSNPYWDERCGDAEAAYEEADLALGAFELDPVAFLRNAANEIEKART